MKKVRPITLIVWALGRVEKNAKKRMLSHLNYYRLNYCSFELFFISFELFSFEHKNSSNEQKK